LDYAGELPPDIEQHIDLERESNNRIVVKLRDDEHANNFLKYLLSHGTTVKAFNEILPTLNEIFIKIVGGASDE
jgi:ABC-2 type transport system ATP-binding protein